MCYYMITKVFTCPSPRCIIHSEKTKGMELWMSDWIPIKDVNQYLLRIKEAISKGLYEYMGSRKENIDSLAKAGLLPKHVKDYILCLTYLDYFNGPEKEKDPRYPEGECIFWGCNINGYEFYIKVKLFKRDLEEVCICLSFHVCAPHPEPKTNMTQYACALDKSILRSVFSLVRGGIGNEGMFILMS